MCIVNFVECVVNFEYACVWALEGLINQNLEREREREKEGERERDYGE